MTPVRTLAYVGFSLVLSLGATAAQSAPVLADQFTSHYTDQGMTDARWDFRRFDHSGTRGRDGLGANVLHPEGPGNVTD